MAFVYTFNHFLYVQAQAVSLPTCDRIPEEKKKQKGHWKGVFKQTNQRKKRSIFIFQENTV